MLSSSVLIQFLYRVLKTLERWYGGSLFHRVVAGFLNGLAIAYRGSFLHRIFYGLMDSFDSSAFFKCFRFLFRLMNTVAEWMRIRLENVASGSKLINGMARFQTLQGALQTVGMISVGFGFSLLVIGILKREVPLWIGIPFLVIGFLSGFLSRNTDEKLRNSRGMAIVKGAASLLVHDEEATSWNEN